MPTSKVMGEREVEKVESQKRRICYDALIEKIN